MTHSSNHLRLRPTARKAPFALLLAASLAGALAAPAPAQPLADEAIRIDVARGSFDDPEQISRIRRRIAAAADTMCDGGGLAGLYRSGARRCREAVIADGERQLAARAAPGLRAAATGAGVSTWTPAADLAQAGDR